MFAHENLQVYAKALKFSATSSAWTSAWDKKHAVVDQLSRATESIMLNLAEAARQRGAPGRLRTLDCSLGSTLECAACLDVARIKQFLTHEQCHAEKRRLCEITKMLVGLRKAWGELIMREEPPASTPGATRGQIEMLFHHEALEVYREALAFMEWFASVPEAQSLSSRLFRRIDEAGTSVVLNIAEGNGRYSELDHLHFLHLAETAAVKGAVYLDLVTERGLMDKRAAAVGKEMLRGISRMVGGF